MNNYFEVGVRYDKTLENGQLKKVTEQYLVEALTFTEAEARTTKEMQSYISGEFRVVTEKMTNISEIILSSDKDADKFYKCKHNLITLDEQTGKEKKMTQYIIIQAASIDDARNKYEDFAKDIICDVVLKEISETKLMDYFPYNAVM